MASQPVHAQLGSDKCGKPRTRGACANAQTVEVEHSANETHSYNPGLSGMALFRHGVSGTTG